MMSIAGKLVLGRDVYSVSHELHLSINSYQVANTVSAGANPQLKISPK
jgi:hypothetical protein